MISTRLMAIAKCCWMLFCWACAAFFAALVVKGVHWDQGILDYVFVGFQATVIGGLILIGLTGWWAR